MARSLCIVHDGSYMGHLATDVYSAGVYVFCKSTKQMVKCAVADQSNDADNYRAKIGRGDGPVDIASGDCSSSSDIPTSRTIL